MIGGPSIAAMAHILAKEHSFASHETFLINCLPAMLEYTRDLCKKHGKNITKITQEELLLLITKELLGERREEKT